MPTNQPDGILGPQESESAVLNPQNAMEAMNASMLKILYENRGYYVSCEFLIGTNNLATKEGILYEVGNNFIVIYEPSQDHYVICDFYSLKFVTFIPSRTPYLPQPESPLPSPGVPVPLPSQNTSPGSGGRTPMNGMGGRMGINFQR